METILVIAGLVVLALVLLGAVIEGGGHGPRVRVSRGIAVGRLKAGRGRVSAWVR